MISFPVPVGGVAFRFVQASEAKTAGAHANCPGTVTKPEAEPGYLCIYAGAEEHVEVESFGQYGVTDFDTKSGIAYFYDASEAEPESPAYVLGSWAVTAG